MSIGKTGTADETDAAKGWQVERVFSQKSDLDEGVKSMATHSAPSLDALRKRFAKGAATDSAIPRIQYADMDADVEIVRVRAKAGGPSKVAYRDTSGKIEIIQG